MEFSSRNKKACLMMIFITVIFLIASACGSDKPTQSECKSYCSHVLECDDTGLKNEEWLAECNDRCTFDEKEASFLSINKDVIACTEIEDCKEFRICVKSGGDGWSTFEE